MLKYDYIHRFLRRHFYRLGGIVATYPYHFTLIPLVTFLILAAGAFRLNLISDFEYLFVPTNSRALKERGAVEKLFPSDNGNLDILRMTRMRLSGTVIIEPKDGGSVFRENIFRSARRIDNLMRNVTVSWNESTFRYEDICLPQTDGSCFSNRVFDLEKKIKEIVKQKTCIRYPIHNEGPFSVYFHAIWLGNVIVDENECIRDAKAIRLSYYLRDDTPTKKEISLKWEENFLEAASQLSADDVHVYRGISSMLDRDGSRFTKLAIPLFYIALPVMLIFTVGSCMTSDCVTSKPWIGIAAFASPLIATVGAFGFCILVGIDYSELNVATPFLMLAIGLDDSFVLLSSWRRTDPKDSVRQRMRNAYAEAAVSITVTSLTNLLSFLIGMTTPYRVHKIFFVYGSVAILFSYIAEITFFGGILALSGYREAKGHHALCFSPVALSNGKTGDNNNQTLFSRGENEHLETKELVTFYRDKLGVLLSKPWAKLVAIVAFLLYCAGGIYGLMFLRAGLESKVLFSSSSYAFHFVQKSFEHFSGFPHVIQVAIHQTLDYSDPLVQKDVDEILSKFANANKMAGTDLAAFWLHSYLSSTDDVRLWYSYRSFNVSIPTDFMTALNKVFLRLTPFRPFNKDVLFDENNTHILASRFFVLSRNIPSGYEEADLISELWKIADTCKYPVYVHNDRFVIQSLSSEGQDICIRTIIISASLAMVVFVITIPNLLCIILVGIAVTTIELCVMGYMSLWNVRLDIVSSTGLIITTGLAVDYLAHVSYAYIVCTKEDPNEKMREALHSSGHPVFQGCFSTILLVCSFLFGNAYLYVILFKILLLLMVFAGFNALIVLPVCLALCETAHQLIRPNKRRAEVTANPMPESSYLVNPSHFQERVREIEPCKRNKSYHKK